MIRLIRDFFVVSAMIVFVPAGALAGHYVIESTTIVDEATAARLDGMGIHTTKELWAKTASEKERRALARKLKVKASLVAEWHDFCDLLRIDGIGPRVAGVMTGAGIRNLKDLAGKVPADMVRRIKEQNFKKTLLGKLPGEENLADWIGQADRLVKEDVTKARKAAGTGKSRRK